MPLDAPIPITCIIPALQELGQNPLTFLRQVLALVEYPALLKPENREWALQKFAPDAIARAEQCIAAMPSTGAYTHSQGTASGSVQSVGIEERGK